MMPVYLRHVETLVPEHGYTQEFASERMKFWLAEEKQRRLASRIYKYSGIDTRYSVLGDFLTGAADPLFKVDAEGKLIEPSTRERNERFARDARKLSVEVARRALAGCPEVSPADVTHVITTTCTGFFSPGPDFHIMRELGLSGATQRYALGFMGCFAALPALRMAWQFCQANPLAVVLVVSIELCSLHLHFAEDTDSLLANALFADGAAAAIVSSRQPPLGGAGSCILESFGSALIPSAEREMAWRIGDKGFEITLSSYVPDIIGANIRPLLESTLAADGLALADVARWAVHPGGKAILDKVQSELGLSPDLMLASREVLRKYGNMSSATILFVIKELLASEPAAGRICAIAFGPGLTVETALLSVVES
ncbi:MAG: type III polyketide synthase [Bryobacteraceae bacterium]